MNTHTHTQRVLDDDECVCVWCVWLKSGATFIFATTFFVLAVRATILCVYEC